MAVGGGGGLEESLSLCPTEELDAVDVGSCALAVVSLGSLGVEELLSESMTVNGRNGERVRVQSIHGLGRGDMSRRGEVLRPSHNF